MPTLIMSAILIFLVVWFVIGFSKYEKRDIDCQAKELEKRVEKYQKEYESLDPVFRKRIELHMKRGY